MLLGPLGGASPSRWWLPHAAAPLIVRVYDGGVWASWERRVAAARPATKGYHYILIPETMREAERAWAYEHEHLARGGLIFLAPSLTAPLSPARNTKVTPEPFSVGICFPFTDVTGEQIQHFSRSAS